MSVVGDVTRGQVTASAVTVLLAGLLYANYLVWQSYLEVVFWAFLLSQALRPLKFAVVSNHCIQRACICVSICLRV